MSKNQKNWGKLIKIAKNWLRISSYLLNALGKFNEIFRKDVFLDNIKSYKKPGFYPIIRRYIFQKTTNGGEGGAGVSEIILIGLYTLGVISISYVSVSITSGVLWGFCKNTNIS